MLWGSLKKSLIKNRQRLVHYSNVEGIKNIDPAHMGSGADARTKGRSTEHPYSFYYRAGSDLPGEDSHIHGQAKSKYTIEIPEDAKIYDLDTDPEGHISKLVEQSKSKQINPGMITQDDIHHHLKSLGVHGFFRSKHPSLSNVVALYHSQPVESEEKL